MEYYKKLICVAEEDILKEVTVLNYDQLTESSICYISCICFHLESAPYEQCEARWQRSFSEPR